MRPQSLSNDWYSSIQSAHKFQSQPHSAPLISLHAPRSTNGCSGYSPSAKFRPAPCPQLHIRSREAASFAQGIGSIHRHAHHSCRQPKLPRDNQHHRCQLHLGSNQERQAEQPGPTTTPASAALVACSADIPEPLIGQPGKYRRQNPAK